MHRLLSEPQRVATDLPRGWTRRALRLRFWRLEESDLPLACLTRGEHVRAHRFDSPPWLDQSLRVMTSSKDRACRERIRAPGRMRRAPYLRGARGEYRRSRQEAAGIPWRRVMRSSSKRERMNVRAECDREPSCGGTVPRRRADQRRRIASLLGRNARRDILRWGPEANGGPPDQANRTLGFRVSVEVREWLAASRRKPGGKGAPGVR